MKINIASNIVGKLYNNQRKSTTKKSARITFYFAQFTKCTHPLNTLATGTLVTVTDVFLGTMSESFLKTAKELKPEGYNSTSQHFSLKLCDTAPY